MLHSVLKKPNVFTVLVQVAKFLYQRDLGTRIKETVNIAGSISKPRLEQATRQILESPDLELDATSAKPRERDASMFNRLLPLIASMTLSMQTSWKRVIRKSGKMNKMVTQATWSLEHVTLRLNTVQSLATLLVTLSPCYGVIKNVRMGTGQCNPRSRARDWRNLRTSKQHPGRCRTTRIMESSELPTRKQTRSLGELEQLPSTRAVRQIPRPTDLSPAEQRHLASLRKRTIPQ